MNKKTFVGFAVAAIVLGLTLSPLAYYQIDAAMEDKMMGGKMMDMMKPVSIRGDLTAPAGDKPFGGDDRGNYLVRVKDNNLVRIMTTVDKAMMDKMMMDPQMMDKMMDKMMEKMKMMDPQMMDKMMMDQMMMDSMVNKMMDKRMMMGGKVLEGWLVDMQSGYKLSMGQLSERNTLVFTQRMVNPWIYDLIVITEEPMDDTDPGPNMPIGGAQLGEPFGK